MVLHTYVLRVQYSCGVVLVFWFWREIGIGVTYNTYIVLSVQYSCVVVSGFPCKKSGLVGQPTNPLNSSVASILWETIVWIYNLTVIIVSQKYRELSLQVEISE